LETGVAETTPSPVKAERIAEGLRDIRRRRRLAHAPSELFFGTGLCLAVLRTVCSECVPGLQHALVVALWPLGGLLIASFFIPVAGLHCPRCGNLFHMGPRYRNDFARRCLHCGLRLNGTAGR
jgi:hypothetical protein